MSRVARRLFAGAFAAALAVGMPGVGKADEPGVKAGVLTCNVASGWGVVFGSSRDLNCTFTNAQGAVERYAGRPPALAEITELLRKADSGVVVNLLGVGLEDRPEFFAQLLPELTSLRSVLGRPHVVIVDEAHHMLPTQWDPGAAAPSFLLVKLP